jgi:hypothetical protein
VHPGTLRARLAGRQALTLYEAAATAGVVFRPCATVRVGPLVVCGGAVIDDAGTAWNAHLELVSYQRSGWEFATGAGLRDGATVRIAVPLTMRWLPLRTRAVRLRAMYSFVGGHRFGAGLEVDLW